ncbi:MAG: hypothetical protein U0992_10580 [Planctomycetaceae bacterium]
MAPLATTSEPMLASSPALAGERVAFTGTLASMTHAQAAELVERHGGMATEHVSRQTTMLVIGEEGWPLDDDGHISVKLQLAQRWRDAGAELRVVNESDWLLLLGLTERRDEIRRLHTPAMLSQLLDVSVHVIRGWERAGLIRPVKRVYRLPYFDFQEVTSARRLSQLWRPASRGARSKRACRNCPPCCAATSGRWSSLRSWPVTRMSSFAMRTACCRRAPVSECWISNRRRRRPSRSLCRPPSIRRCPFGCCVVTIRVRGRTATATGLSKAAAVAGRRVR